MSVLPFTGSPTIAFQQWDPAAYPGYNLTGIDLYLEGTLSGNVSWTLNEGDDVWLEITTKATMKLQTSGVDLVTTIPEQFNGWYNLPPPASDNVALDAFNSNTEAVAPAYWAAFTGNGTVDLDLIGTVNRIREDSGGNFTLGGTSSGEASGRVTYTYEPEAIPEPGTLALVGFGLVGLLALRRRKQS